MTEDQKGSLEEIFGGKEKQSALDLYDRMREMLDQLRIGTEEKIH